MSFCVRFVRKTNPEWLKFNSRKLGEKEKEKQIEIENERRIKTQCCLRIPIYSISIQLGGDNR